MSKIIQFFKEHDDIEIVAVYLPTALTAVIIVLTLISGIVGLF